ncbi:MAG: glutathione binding-like protein, partial [Betaproteobacteria bacterium]
WKDIAMANLERRLGYVDQQLTGRSYLMGEDFSVADAYLFTVLSWAKYAKIDLGRWPAVQAFQARVAARPAVQSALKDEGLI